MKIVAKNIQKSYRNREVLKNISFTIGDNEIVAILGPNGVGKTTLLEILMTLRKWDFGEITILGHDIRKEMEIQQVRGKIGVVFQEGGMYAYLKIKEILDLFAALYNIPKERIQEVITLFSLKEHLNTKFEKLSGGWKKRILLAISFLNHPELIFLDEPTTGLDPKATNDLWNAIKLAKKNGTSILLSTHSIEEVDMYADRVMIINDGVIAEFDTTKALKQKYQCNYLKEVYFTVVEGEKALGQVIN